MPERVRIEIQITRTDDIDEEYWVPPRPIHVADYVQQHLFGHGGHMEGWAIGSCTAPTFRGRTLAHALIARAKEEGHDIGTDDANWLAGALIAWCSDNDSFIDGTGIHQR